jgi:predicted esterase
MLDRVRAVSACLALLPLLSAGAACGPEPRLVVSPGAPIDPGPVRAVAPGEPSPEPRPATSADADPEPEIVELKVPLDKKIFVLAGKRDANRVVVYLHGRCGNPLAFQAFQRAIRETGTLVSLRGGKKCDYNQEWDTDVLALHRRIRRAIEVAGRAVSLPLATYPVTVVGYSQGATRAEQLARTLPAEYRRVVLVGGPTEPQVGALGSAERVAIVAGEWDARGHLKEGLDKLRAAKVPVLYRELPKVGHGSYGQGAEPVFTEVLRWVRD